MQNRTTVVGQQLALVQTGAIADAPSLAAVWSHYAERHPRAIMDNKRRTLIMARLTEGYTVEALCTAIDGCHGDAWYMGANDRGTAYCDIELILRDAGHVEQFIRMAMEPRVPTNTNGNTVTAMAGGNELTQHAAMKMVTRAAQ